MRLFCVSVLLFLMAGCGCNRGTPEAEGPPVADPNIAITAEFEKAPNGTEWLMDPKHTLKGLSLEAGNELCKKLLDLGAVDLKATDIVPDAADPTFASAGTLLIALPDDANRRAALFQEVQNRDPQEIPRKDTGQRHIRMFVRVGAG